MSNIVFKRFLSALFFLAVCFTFVSLMSDSVLAKYCPQCGVYNADSNVYCVKCGTEFKNTNAHKIRVGIIFISSVHPGDSAKFTIYYKGSVTPFFVWNPKGKYEIGETRLPILEDMIFVSMRETEIPNLESIPELAKKYKVDKIMVMNYNSKKTERVPLFSSQSYDVYFDITTYDASHDSVLQEKRYEGSLKSWPNVTVVQVRDVCNNLWEQMVPNIRILLTK